jgi:GTPase SAR1 family protein
MPPTTTNPNQPINVKLLLIGNSSVGKSSLLLRFSDEQWLPEDESSATIGVDFRVSRSSLRSDLGCLSVLVGCGVATKSAYPYRRVFESVANESFSYLTGTQDGNKGKEGEAQHMGEFPNHILNLTVSSRLTA